MKDKKWRGLGVEGLYFTVYLERVPECLSPASEWTQKWRGEQHLLAGEGLVGPNSDDWTESLALCILCGAGYVFS